MTTVKKIGKLSAYCKKNGISIYRLSMMTGVQRSYLKRIDEEPTVKIGAETMQKLFAGTEKEFETGIKPDQYLDLKKYSFLK